MRGDARHGRGWHGRVGLLSYTLSTSLALAQLNSGWSWQNPLPAGNSLLAVALIDVDTAVAVGRFGTILRTGDGGVTWRLQSAGTTADLHGVCFTDPQTGTVVGSGGAILRTNDGGLTWSSQWPVASYT